MKEDSLYKPSFSEFKSQLCFQVIIGVQGEEELLISVLMKSYMNSYLHQWYP